MLGKNIVSIIIPIFNVENYIERALLSVVRQTYENLEVILVNDGSTDSSLQICNEYAKKDSRIIIINQKNSGVSVARNNGLKIARGDYVRFFDPDDEIALDSTEKLLRIMETENCDMVISGYEKRDWCGNFLSERIPQKQEFLDAKTIINTHYFTGSQVSLLLCVPWSSMFRREFLEKNKILFNFRFHPGEDVLFIAECLSFFPKIAILNLVTYFYYDYKKSNRFAAMNYVYPDIYKVQLLQIELILLVLENSNERTVILLRFFDLFIKHLVISFMYKDFFRNTGLRNELNNIIKNKYVIESAQKYKMSQAAHIKRFPLMFFVSLCIRKEWLEVLYRIIDYASFIFSLFLKKSKFVKSICR